MNKYRKKTIVFLSILGILLCSGFAVNWYITNRLEAKIAEILARNVNEATDGLYTLTYDKLSIGLYDGELSISNLHFFPDSTVYNKWKENDSLPKEILDLKFKNIHFNGLNLKLIRDNRDLGFTIFDIIDPEIKVVVPVAAGKTGKTEPSHIEDPYQLIKNHLKTLNVQELNLKNAQVKYIVEDPVKPAVYSIDNTDFSIYNFHLDKNSYKNGKLLFSDNITFKINKHQTLLSNKEFNLSINKLELSTKDSVIIINGLKLESSKESKAEQSRELDAQLNQIAFRGVSLSRNNEDRILTAKKFSIDAPEIKMSYKSLSPSKENNLESRDSIIVQSASLYDIISPILAKIRIDTIAINKANFDYSVYNEDVKSNYSFNNLNFAAENFLIDSSYISKYDFIHCEEFSLDAKDLQASIAELNYKMNIGSLLFDTKKRLLSIENIGLQPLSNLENSVTGKIRKILSNDLTLKGNAINSRRLYISDPDINIKNKSEPKQNKHPETTKKQSPKLGVSIHLDFIKLDNGFIKLQQDSDLYFANDVDMSIFNFSFHNNYEIKDLIANITHLGGKLNSSSASFEASDIEYNSIEKKFEASNLSYSSSSLSLMTEKFNITDLSFEGIEKDSINASLISLSIVNLNNKDLSFNSPNISLSGFSWATNKASIDNLKTQHPQFTYLSRELEIKAELENLSIEGITYANNELIIDKNVLEQPSIYFSLSKGEAKKRELAKVSLEQIRLGEISINKGNLQVENIRSYIDKFTDIDINARQIEFSPNTQKLDYETVACTVPDLSIPLDNGFYTLSSDKVFAQIRKSDIDIEIADIHLKSKYPKFEFAHHHPKNKDWFGLSIASVKLGGVDIANLKQERIYAKTLSVNDTYLENLKNQNIKIQHNIMPMIYEVIQKFPKEFKVADTNIKNFNVVYEEIARGKETPGKIFFTDMNGKIANFTNKADHKAQYLDVFANGYLMGTGYFDALWQIPVSAEHDNFNLSAELVKFDLKELNQLITPMAPAAIISGYAPCINFNISASSIDAHVDMTFIYNDLNISLWSQHKDKIKNKKLYSKAVNLLLNKDNPDKGRKEPRVAGLDVVRDPYHSTFNYFWQILQPPIAESVGVSEKRQNRLKKAGTAFNNLKNFFSFKKKEKSAGANNHSPEIRPAGE